MSAITPTELKTRYPIFSSIPDATVQIFIDEAEEILNVAYWGDKYTQGLQAYIAHTLVVEDPTGISGGGAGISGPVAARSVDGASVSYANNVSSDLSVGDAYFQLTKYGQNYLRLRNSLRSGASVI